MLVIIVSNFNIGLLCQQLLRSIKTLQYVAVVTNYNITLPYYYYYKQILVDQCWWSDNFPVQKLLSEAEDTGWDLAGASKTLSTLSTEEVTMSCSRRCPSTILCCRSPECWSVPPHPRWRRSGRCTGGGGGGEPRQP